MTGGERRADRVNQSVGRAWTTDQDLEHGRAQRRQGLGDGECGEREPAPARRAGGSRRRRARAHQPRPRPSALKTSATSVSSGDRMSCIASDQRRSTSSGSMGTTTAMSATTPSNAIPSQNERAGRERKRSGGLVSDAMDRGASVSQISDATDSPTEAGRSSRSSRTPRRRRCARGRRRRRSRARGRRRRSCEPRPHG